MPIKVKSEEIMVNITRIYVSHLGGTICMEKDKDGSLVPATPEKFQSAIRNEITLHDPEFMNSITRNGQAELKDFFILPANDNGYIQGRVAYKIDAAEKLLDSTNMDPGHWLDIGKKILSKKDNFDAFVILTGTDTMAYGASILSFTLLSHIEKIVVLTGSQKPIFDDGTDAKTNILGALTMAAIAQRKEYKIKDICIFFHKKLLRGNRAVKYDANEMDAFAAPNLHHLARVGENGKITIKKDILLEKLPIIEDPLVNTLNTEVKALNTKVGSITIDPYMIPKPEELLALIGDKKGVVIKGFGTGNIPTSLLDVFKAKRSEVIFILISQCFRGRVLGIYKTGNDAMLAGLTSGFDMTAEAALAKLSYILSMDQLKLKQKKKVMEMNLRGELTQQPETPEPSEEVKRIEEESEEEDVEFVYVTKDDRDSEDMDASEKKDSVNALLD